MVRENKADVLIVGAGMAGLMAATRLKEAGLRAVIVEAKPFVGGRMASQGVGPGLADTGAQFFTARTKEFFGWVNRWITEGVLYEWSQGWSDGSLGTIPPSGHSRYAARGGMSALAEYLADGLDIRLNTRLTQIKPGVQGWQTRDDHGGVWTASTLILTPPVPHSLALLDAGQVTLAEPDRALLQRIDYAPCLTGLFWINGSIRMPEPGAVQRPNGAITWIADNRRKGISPDATIMTVQAGPEYSRQLWDWPDAEILRALESSLNLFKDAQAHTVQSQLERWRYAMPAASLPNLYLVAMDLPPLIFAGDAFGTPRVEGAALSGLSAASALVAEGI